MTRVRGQQGFTLIEVLVAISLATVVLGAVVTSFVTFLDHSERTNRRADAQDAARQSMDVIATELRSAMATSQSNNQPIEDLRDYSLTYLVPHASAALQGNPLGLQHVRYCLTVTTTESVSLWRETAPYNNGAKSLPPANGTATCPSSAWTTHTQVATNLVNQMQTPAVPFFTPTTDASGSITDVGLRAYVSVRPGKDKPTSVRSSVTLRNLNHKPTAAISCAGGSNGHIICDASGSTDQDGQTLTFAWTVDGVAQSETSYRIDKSGLTSGSSHTMAVTVTDSGGLTGTAQMTAVAQ